MPGLIEPCSSQEDLAANRRRHTHGRPYAAAAAGAHDHEHRTPPRWCPSRAKRRSRQGRDDAGGTATAPKQRQRPLRRRQAQPVARDREGKPIQGVSGRLQGLLSNRSPYIERARTRAKQTANRRGLMNSSIAAGAGEAAAIDSALPIAQGDAAIAAGERGLRSSGIHAGAGSARPAAHAGAWV